MIIGITAGQMRGPVTPPVSAHAVESWSPRGNTGSSFRRGFEFSVTEALTVSQLRVLGGSSSGSDIRVIIHRVYDGAVLASADLLPPSSGYSAIGISSIVLIPGVVYCCTGRRITSAANVPNGGSPTFDSRVVLSRYVSGSDDTLPTTSVSGTWAWADFGF